MKSIKSNRNANTLNGIVILKSEPLNVENVANVLGLKITAVFTKMAYNCPICEHIRIYTYNFSPCLSGSNTGICRIR